MSGKIQKQSLKIHPEDNALCSRKIFNWSISITPFFHIKICTVTKWNSSNKQIKVSYWRTFQSINLYTVPETISSLIQCGYVIDKDEESCFSAKATNQAQLRYW